MELKHWNNGKSDIRVDGVSINSEMTFKEFKIKAMQKLMKQFLSIPDTKDTVLTRKNIIEMIKDLNQMG
jgi:hypothetical protein